MFTPRNLLALLGTMLFLIALYLVLEKAGGASQVFGALANGGLALIGGLQGRTVVNGSGAQVSGTP